jgi:hypothetical protein
MDAMLISAVFCRGGNARTAGWVVLADLVVIKDS